MRLNQNAGDYALSFFNICLNDMEAFSEDACRNSATFVHEFLHYLQDLALPYNIRLNMSQWCRFRDLRDVAPKSNCDGSEGGAVELPFDKWTKDTQLLICQQDRTLGSSKMVQDITSLPEIKVTSEHIDGVYDFRLQRLREFDVYQYTATINGEPYQLGAGQLLEYIAWKIEAKHCSGGVDVPPLPYQVVDMLFEKYNLGFFPDCIRINFAELCLFNDHPMHFLIHSILEPNQNLKLPPSVDLQKLYEGIYRDNLITTFKTTDGTYETLAEKRKRRWTDLMNLLKGQFQQFPTIRAWITRVNQYAWEHWQNRFLFSDLYIMDTPQFHQEIWNLVEELGVPLVFNNKRELFSMGAVTDYSEFLQFYILQEYLDYLTEDSSDVLGLRSFAECSTVGCPLFSQEIKCGVLDESGSILLCDDADKKSVLCHYPTDFTNVFEGATDCPYKRFLEQHSLSKLKVTGKV